MGKEEKEKNIKLRKQNFYKRWNIEIDDYQKLEGFKKRVLLTLQDMMKPIFDDSKDLLFNYCKLIGLYVTDDQLYSSGWNLKYIGGTFFMKEVDFAFLTSDLGKTIFYLQNLFYLNLDDSIKEKLYNHFKEGIELSLLDIAIKKIKDGEYIFYPKGAKFLDEGVVNDVLDWLAPYPEAYKNFVSALKKYEDHNYERNLIDDLRLSLELLLKKILKNKMNLKNQKGPLGNYLKDKGTPTEIREMFATLVMYYDKYQNEYAKHNDKVRESEVEFMIYLTGTFMRFLLSLETNLNNSTIANKYVRREK